MNSEFGTVYSQGTRYGTVKRGYLLFISRDNSAARHTGHTEQTWVKVSRNGLMKL